MPMMVSNIGMERLSILGLAISNYYRHLRMLELVTDKEILHYLKLIALVEQEGKRMTILMNNIH